MTMHRPGRRAIPGVAPARATLEALPPPAAPARGQAWPSRQGRWQGRIRSQGRSRAPSRSRGHGRGPGQGRSRERGSATAELAVAMPIVVLTLLLGIGALGAGMRMVALQDAVADAARILGRGDAIPGPGRRWRGRIPRRRSR